ncbi:uncharacterized protein TNCV_4935441 [Trichonephila clavipes]|nr:uncharacterized protein TNCV_4935441 [Trichonephila clavipes]
MMEEKRLDHIVSRLEAQLLDYVEFRHPQTTSSLLQVIDKYEEKFLNRMSRGPSHDFRSSNRSVNNQFTNRNRQENWRDTKVKTRYHYTSRPQRESNRFGGQSVGDNRRFNSGRRSGQSDHRFSKHDGRQGGSINSAFRGQNGQDRVFFNVYMNDVIITSPSFTEHVDHLNQVFTLLQTTGLILNKDKCHLARDKLKYLELIISKDGIKTNDNKVKPTVRSLAGIIQGAASKNQKDYRRSRGVLGSTAYHRTTLEEGALVWRH